MIVAALQAADGSIRDVLRFAIPLVVVAGSVLAVARLLVRAVERRRESADRRRSVRYLPGVVADLVGAMRDGATLEVALREVAPHVEGVLGRELRGAVDLLDRGHGTDRVMSLWARASRVDGVELLVAACRFPDRGSGLERALDGVSATLNDRIEVADELHALAAQSRTSAVVLVALPPTGAVVFALLQPSFVHVVVGTTAGRLCLVSGVLLDIAGARVSSRIVTSCVDGTSGRGHGTSRMRGVMRGAM